MKRIKPTTESIVAVTLELQSTMRPGWLLSRVGDEIHLHAPPMSRQDLRSEVWRLARFVAYDAFVSIQRSRGPLCEYLITSCADVKLSFALRVKIAKLAEDPDETRTGHRR